MDNCVGAAFSYEPHHESSVTDVAFDELHVARNGGAHAAREIVEDRNPLACFDECEDHMAADITGASRYNDAHVKFAPNIEAVQMALYDEAVVENCFMNEARMPIWRPADFRRAPPR